MTEAIAGQASRYTLGASDQEVERLDRQSTSIENATPSASPSANPLAS